MTQDPDRQNTDGREINRGRKRTRPQQLLLQVYQCGTLIVGDNSRLTPTCCLLIGTSSSVCLCMCACLCVCVIVFNLDSLFFFIILPISASLIHPFSGLWLLHFCFFNERMFFFYS